MCEKILYAITDVNDTSKCLGLGAKVGSVPTSLFCFLILKILRTCALSYLHVKYAPTKMFAECCYSSYKIQQHEQVHMHLIPNINIWLMIFSEQLLKGLVHLRSELRNRLSGNKNN